MDLAVRIRHYEYEITELLLYSEQMSTNVFLQNRLFLSLGSLLETQATSYPTRSTFQRLNNLVFTESACGQNPIVNTQNYKGRETFPSIHLEFSFFQPEYCLHSFLCTPLGRITQQLDTLSLSLS